MDETGSQDSFLTPESDPDSAHLSEQRFADLDIDPKVQQGVAATGFEFCTPIQALALPIALEGRDVAGQAQTGTGKTAAFLIATFNLLLRKSAPESQGKQLRALILAPTRELAIQIHEDAKTLGQHTGLRLALAYGGTDYQKQRDRIDAGVDVLIGTPGRVIDYFKQGVFAIKQLEVMVLDEADRMFDLGFIKDIRYLFRAMSAPDQRLSMMFSATLSLRVKELAYEHMNSPESVVVETEKVTADRVIEKAYLPSNPDKLPLLMGLLKQYEASRSLVFINTKHMAETVRETLSANGFDNALLSGDVPQRKRETLLAKFKQGKVNILIATDVAARGLHIPDVAVVINFDLPQDAEDYVHRIGRTARAGAAGTAISLICETFGMHAVDIENYTGHKLPVEKDFEDLLFEDAVIVEHQPRRKRDKTRGRKETKPKTSRQEKPKDIKPKASEPVKLKTPKDNGRSSPVKNRVRRNDDTPAVG